LTTAPSAWRAICVASAGEKPARLRMSSAASVTSRLPLDETVRVETSVAAAGCARSAASKDPNSERNCSGHGADGSTAGSTASKMRAAMPSSNSSLLRKCQ
jgi:hypothetical protein